MERDGLGRGCWLLIVLVLVGTVALVLAVARFEEDFIDRSPSVLIHPLA